MHNKEPTARSKLTHQANCHYGGRAKAAGTHSSFQQCK